MTAIQQLLALLLGAAPASALQAPSAPPQAQTAPAKPQSPPAAPKTQPAPQRGEARTTPAPVRRDELAHALVASEEITRGDVDAWFVRVEGLLSAQHPASATDEAALLLMMGKADELNEPRAWSEVLERLQSANAFDPHARALVIRLAQEQRLAHMDQAELERAHGEDQFPEYVADFKILSPLAGPEPTQSGEDLFVYPGFDSPHPGLRGQEARWASGRRDNLRSDVAPQEWVEPNQGWSLLAFEFDLPEDVSGAVEIDTRRSWGQRVLPWLMSIERPWSSVTGDPTWKYSLNGSAPVTVDPVGAEIDPVVLATGLLHKGRNRVLVWCRTDAHPAFAIRVLVPERADGSCAGRPLPLTRTAGAAQLHSSGDALRIATLALRLPRDTPEQKALLGLVLLEDGRAIEGLALLRAASEAAPDDLALGHLYARALQDSPCLPEVWRRSAARARFEALAARGQDLDVELQLARALVLEDHEEDALTRLENARKQFPGSPLPLLEMARVYPHLEMKLFADQARDAALGLAPHSQRVLDFVAEELSSDGLHTRAAAMRKLQAEQIGAGPESMKALSDELAAAGDVEGAERALRDARLRAGGRRYTQDLADFLFEHEHLDEADALYADLAAAYPRWDLPWLHRAQIARRRGDARAEKEMLAQTLTRDPSSEAARVRLIALGGPDRTEALFARYRADREEALSTYDDKRWNDSVVRVLDCSVLRVFRDGSSARITHDILQVKDLDGCKNQGKQRMSGTVEKIVTIKAGTKAELEPVDVNGEYVMPSLKPGDYIERISRETNGFPEVGARALESWLFASGSEPYHVSRFVVILPRGHAYELEQHDFDGRHDVTIDGDDEVHVFETRDRDRLQHEPGAPPIKWLVPWIQFGKHWDFAAEAQHELFQQSRLATRVTPEIRSLAESAMTSDPALSSGGEEARAIALYDAARKAVKKPNTRSNLSATATLLGEAGNPAYLYSALLRAAGIEHELGWSRDASFAASLEPDQPFPDASRWEHRLLVLVKPNGAEASWCDLSVHDMPYGRILGNADGAEVMTPHGMTHLPALASDEVAGVRFTVRIEAAADGTAKATVGQEPTGNFGYVNKDRFKETPEAKRKADAGRLFAAVLPGFELSELESIGLDDERPISLLGHGRVQKFLDESDAGSTAKLPMPPVNLTQTLAGGEGQRKFPYYLRTTYRAVTDVEIALPEGMRLADGPPTTREQWFDCRYELVTDIREPGKIKIQRTIQLSPFLATAEEYAAFAAFCARADEVERVPLRFVTQ